MKLLRYLRRSSPDSLISAVSDGVTRTSGIRPMWSDSFSYSLPLRQLSPAPLLERAYDTLGAICRRLAVATVHEERLAAVPHALGVGQAESALAHRKVVDRVEQIRLAGPVVADHAVDLRRELDLGLADVLEVDQGKSLKVHVGTESVAGGNPPAIAIKGRHFFGNVQGRSLLRSGRGTSFSDGGRTGRAESRRLKITTKRGGIVLYSPKKVTFAFQYVFHFNFLKQL